MKLLLSISLALVVPACALTVRKGDVFEWSRQNLRTMSEVATRVTVLDQGASDTLPADSGVAWGVLVEPEGAPAETLELFQFKDGALRWTRPSARFPVELDAPRNAAAKWVRCGFYWGMPGVGKYVEQYRSYGPQYNVSIWYDTSGSDGASKVNCEAQVTSPYLMGLGKNAVQGRWTDSVGPVWYSDTVDWTLVRRNGRAIGWINPRMDSVRAVLAGLRLRAAAIRHPLEGERFVWRHTESFNQIPSRRADGRTSWTDAIKVTATVVAAPSDSAGWIRRTLRYDVDSTNGGSSSWMVSYRRDSLGAGVEVGGRYPALDGSWSVDRGDALDSSERFSRSVNESWGKGNATYSTNGVLFGVRATRWGSVPNGCTSCVDSWASEWALLSAPGWVAGASGRSRPAPSRIDGPRMQELLATDPHAIAVWTSPEGRSDRGTIRDFQDSNPGSGVLWLVVRTSRGETLQGKFLKP